MTSAARRVRRAGIMLGACLLGLAGSAMGAVPPRGSAAPPISLYGLEGDLIETSRFSGRPMVLIFGDLVHEGARRASAEVLEILRDERLAAREIVPIFLTAQSSSAEELRDQAAGGGIPAVTLRDPERSAFGAYDILVIPSVVVVDGAGTVVYAAPGLLPRFRELVTESLLVCTGQESAQEFERSLGAGEPPAAGENSVRAERLLHLAEQLAAHDLNDMAEARCREALALVPDSVPARLMLGELLRRGSRLDEAEAQLRALVEADPGLPGARLSLARVLIDRGEASLAEAEGLVRGVLAGDVRSPGAHYQLGLILERRGDLPGAASAYRRAAELLLER